MSTSTYTIKSGQTTATQIIWAGDGPTLISNTSLTAIIYVGNSNTINTADGVGIAPINPNGSIVVDGTRDYYAVTNSVTPVTIATFAGGLATFLGLTQSLGSLAIPSIHSPNYVAGVSGWTVNQDGSAELNNLTLRGNQVFPNGFISNGNGTYTNQPGLFLYSGTPAAGNLILSDTNAAGTDKFGNKFLSGTTGYDNVNFVAESNSGSILQWYLMTPQPGSVFTAAGQINSQNIGTLVAISNSLQISNILTSGQGVLDATVQGNLQSDNPIDGNKYILGHNVQEVAGTIGIPSTAFVTVLAQNVASGMRYKFRALISYNTTTTAAGTPTFSWAHSTTATIGLWMSKAAIWNNSGLTIASAQFTHSATVPGDLSGPAFVANSRWIYEIEGFIGTAGAGPGVITLSANTSSAADPYNIETGSYFELEPLS